MLKCPKCHAALAEKSQKCRCGFDIMKDSLATPPPLSISAIYKAEKHIERLLPKIICGMEIMYPNREKYVGDVKSGKRHGIGELCLADGTVNEGVWIDDMYSEKLSNLRKHFSLIIWEFGHEFWDAFDLTALSQADKDRISQKIVEEVEVLVGTKISTDLTDEQLQEFVKLDSYDAANWLESHCPDYYDIVRETSQVF